MGFLDKFKKQKRQQPPLPPVPPKPPAGDSYSHEELVPPPKIIDFDEEIPDLPELDIPEELGGKPSEEPTSVPQPKSEIVPPPQGHSEEAEEGIAEEDLSPESKPGSGTGSIELQGTEEKKPIETEPSPTPEMQPEKAEGETKPKEKPKPLQPITYFHTGKMYVNDETYGEIVKELNEINDMVSSSSHFKALQQIASQKEEAIRAFKEEVNAILTALDHIDSIAFSKG